MRTVIACSIQLNTISNISYITRFIEWVYANVWKMIIIVVIKWIWDSNGNGYNFPNSSLFYFMFEIHLSIRFHTNSTVTILHFKLRVIYCHWGRYEQFKIWIWTQIFGISVDLNWESKSTKALVILTALHNNDDNIWLVNIWTRDPWSVW